MIQILHVLAVISFGLAAFSCPWPKPVNWFYMGVFLLSLAYFIAPSL